MQIFDDAYALDQCYKRGMFEAWGATLKAEYPSWGALCQTCDASQAPMNGRVGDCTDKLLRGSTCQPVCNGGFAINGKSACNNQNLVAASCEIW